MPPPTATGEVYCLSHRQLFSALVGVSYIIRKVFESKFRNWFSLSVFLSVSRSSNELLDFRFYPKSFMLYINGFVYASSTKLFLSNFKLVFELLAKNQKKFKQMARREYWSKCNVLYINRFVKTNEKLFFSISESFFEYLRFFKIIVALGLGMWGGEGICASVVQDNSWSLWNWYSRDHQWQPILLKGLWTVLKNLSYLASRKAVGRALGALRLSQRVRDTRGTTGCQGGAPQPAHGGPRHQRKGPGPQQPWSKGASN